VGRKIHLNIWVFLNGGHAIDLIAVTTLVERLYSGEAFEYAISNMRR